MAQAMHSHVEHRGLGMAFDGPSAFTVISTRSVALECRLFRDRVQFCSGLVDLVICEVQDFGRGVILSPRFWLCVALRALAARMGGSSSGLARLQFRRIIDAVIDDVRIPCHGEQLAAYVYRPGVTPGDAPCVVMAHGFSGTRDDGLPGYAEAFRDAGFVVVLFDYRHFGDSTGEPRQLLSNARQLDDYRAVIEWARALDGVDPDRIVLWGTSYSGGHVLTIAAADARIAAVIAQGPYTDSIATMMCVDAPKYRPLCGGGPA